MLRVNSLIRINLIGNLADRRAASKVLEECISGTQLRTSQQRQRLPQLQPSLLHAANTLGKIPNERDVTECCRSRAVHSKACVHGDGSSLAAW